MSFSRPIAVARARVRHRARLSPAAASQPPQDARDSSAPAIVVDARMRELYRLAERVAPYDVPVVVLGETGVGKELLVQALHRASGRTGPLTVVNCGAIPRTLTESVLFGHERGAFTGAESRRRGAFEQAHRGTLFLDEVGELSPEAQVALLRVLEDSWITRLGGEPIEVDTRVVAATHCDLEAMVAAGSFRQDLWYRINTIALEIPPLRRRRSEIEPLARAFLASAVQRFGSTVRGFGPTALDVMLRYAWPGNVRQLRAAVEQSVVIAEGPLIEIDDLPPALRACTAEGAPSQDGSAALRTRS